MAATASSSPATANASSAFLRGVERRALVVADLQAGATGMHAVAAAMRAFAGHAATTAMVDWPTRFWGLLCNVPQLRAPVAGTATPLPHLSALQAGDRLALLLRVGAGLDEAVAAASLGMDTGAYRQALARACPLDARGQPDAVAWRALAEQVQAQVRDLSPDRLRQLGQLRDAVTAKPAPAPVAARAPRPAAQPRARRGWLLLGLSALVLAAMAAWWWHEYGAVLPGNDGPPAEGALGDNGPIQIESLPDDSEPAAAVDSHAADDAAMLADPELALAQDADFHAWYAAGAPVPVDESQAAPDRGEPASAALETVDAED
ncbi:conserved hypothetical protein [uncultured Stenotrophomonas sp.]|uniref:Transmembrane protein n=1 Tax=uncultured Stenotrophomonas sp. TaxID=165438 RepID=A0A1Y5QAJ5_9GAMM|nr:conserved hypothetical protein [uncultured Stenotrophomonas sp.]